MCQVLPHRVFVATGAGSEVEATGSAAAETPPFTGVHRYMHGGLSVIPVHGRLNMQSLGKP